MDNAVKKVLVSEEEINQICKKLGEEIEMPPQTINRYENGENIPTIIQALKIADYFNMSIELFILMGIIAIEEDADILPLYDQLDKAMEKLKNHE